MGKKRIPSKDKTIRKTIPISVVSITDKYKSDIKENLKDKHKDCLTDKVVLEIMMKSLNEMSDKEFLKVVMKKIPKKYKK